VLRRAIKLSPRRAAEHRDLAVLLASLGREDEAREEYQKALAVDPNDASVWVNLANLERRAGNLERALELYREAEQRDSNFSLAVQGQIGVLTQLKRDTEAGNIYRRWLRLRPDDHNARLEAVRHFNEAGRGDIGLELARDGVRQNRRSGDAHMIMGIALQYRGQARAALAELRSAEKFFTEPGARARVQEMIATMRAAAPDSLRAMFAADSVAHAVDSTAATARRRAAGPSRADNGAGKNRADSAAAGRRKP
jgi:tetratricopeptide (TPR) repeat protein